MHTVIIGVTFVGGIELMVSANGIGLVSVGKIELVFVVDFVASVDNLSSVKIWTESFPPGEIAKQLIGLPLKLASCRTVYYSILNSFG